VITFEQLATEVRRIIAENPDFVYQRPGDGRWCLYLHYEDREPTGGGCVFGRAFLNLGLTYEDIMPCERKYVVAAFRALGIETNQLQSGWATLLQERQDQAQPWGECLRYADTECPLGQA